MSNVVRAALVQATWTGDTESMIAKHEEHARSRRRAGRQGHRLPGGLQRPLLLPGPGARALPLGRAGARRARPSQRMQELARETGMVIVVPVFEVEQSGLLLQHRGGHRRRRHLPRQVPQAPHPAGQGLLGEVLLQARATSAGRSSTPPSAGSASTSATTGTSPRAGARSGWPAPSSCTTRPPPRRGLSAYLWQLEQPAAAVANEYFIAAINRVGQEEYGDNDFYGTSYFVDPRGQFVGEVAPATSKEELVVRDLDFDLIDEVRQQWAFYRDRRPDAYGDLTEA